ncbi:MAG: hypothetical protein PHG05_01955 [Candidatus Nanoarchaeia archaeon]|nr:hypothetical protein [Candidatus Nanoarchaeia archaeon]
MYKNIKLIIALWLIFLAGCTTLNAQNKDTGDSTSNPSRGIKLEAIDFLNDYSEVSSGKSVPLIFELTNNMPESTNVDMVFQDFVEGELGGFKKTEKKISDLSGIKGIESELGKPCIDRKNCKIINLGSIVYNAVDAQESITIRADVTYDVKFESKYTTCVGVEPYCNKKENLGSNSRYDSTYPVGISRIERNYPLSVDGSQKVIFTIYFADLGKDLITRDRELNNINLEFGNSAIECPSKFIVSPKNLEGNKITCEGNAPTLEKGQTDFDTDVTVSFNYKYTFSSHFGPIKVNPLKK